MNKCFILMLMVFFHIIDDYRLQGILANMKQKSWWRQQEQYADKYKYDYLIALFMHSFSWAFMIMLPIAIANGFNISAAFVVVFITNLFIHGFIDDLKANQFKINLVQDQLVHIIQIVITALILAQKVGGAKMLDNEITIKDFKALIFEIYSAGFESGYAKEIDIVSAFNQFWQDITTQN